MGRVHRETLLLDLRSVFARQDQLLVKAVQALANHETEKAATSATGPPADPPQDAS
jgi:hypothetical protein